MGAILRLQVFDNILNKGVFVDKGGTYAYVANKLIGVMAECNTVGYSTAGLNVIVKDTAGVLVFERLVTFLTGYPALWNGANFTMPDRSVIVYLDFYGDQVKVDATTLSVTTAAKKSASITLSWSADTKYGSAVVKGDAVRFSGKVADAATGVGLAGVPVDVYLVGSLLVYLTTDSGGAYATERTMPTTAGAMPYDFIFPGNADYSSAVISVSITVEARLPKLILSLSVPSAMVGATMIWDGSLTDPKVTSYTIAGKSVYLEQGASATGPWASAAGPVSTKSDGTYSGTYVFPSTPGTYYYRSRFPGGSPGITWEISLSGVTAVKIYATEDEAEAARMRALILGALAAVAILYIATRRYRG